MNESQPTAQVGQRTHPLIIVAAGAVTLFCLVGIGVMAGLIPVGAGAELRNTGTAAAVPSPVAAGLASAPVGSVVDDTTPGIKPQNETKPAAAGLPPIQSKAFGQPNARLDAKAAAQSGNMEAPAMPVAPTPTTATAGAGNTPAPTPVYTQGNRATNGDKALSASAASVSGGSGGSEKAVATPAPEAVPQSRCDACGVVAGIYTLDRKVESSGTGAVIGGLIGGVLGHQAGSGRGKDVATVAGAVGGALIGNQIEKSNVRTGAYEVRVRMEDNTYRSARFEGEPQLRVGDRVRFKSNGQLSRQ